MRVVIQRAVNASCVVDDQLVSQIDKGLMILVGFTAGDTSESLDYFLKKIPNLRIFSDENGQMNLSVLDIKGEILLISQFTLYASTKKGNRPSFIEALEPTKASMLYDEFVDKMNEIVPTKKGLFGADMKINFTNDGPVTIIMEK